MLAIQKLQEEIAISMLVPEYAEKIALKLHELFVINKKSVDDVIYDYDLGPSLANIMQKTDLIKHKGTNPCYILLPKAEEYHNKFEQEGQCSKYGKNP